jgi:hypothetical protein
MVKDECFSPKIWKKTMMPAPAIYILMFCKFQPVQKGKNNKGIQIEKEDVKISLFTEEIFV